MERILTVEDFKKGDRVYDQVGGLGTVYGFHKPEGEIVILLDEPYMTSFGHVPCKIMWAPAYKLQKVVNHE